MLQKVPIPKEVREQSEELHESVRKATTDYLSDPNNEHNTHNLVSALMVSYPLRRKEVAKVTTDPVEFRGKAFFNKYLALRENALVGVLLCQTRCV
jgi:hypothetical protein